MISSTNAVRQYWYKRFRSAAYASAAASLVLTVLIVLPFPPFSSLPPIIVGGGPGTWLVLAYILTLSVGVAGFGVLSGFLYTIEVQENRAVSSSVMWSGFALLGIGFAASCALLALAGALGGHASTIDSLSGSSLQKLLEPYVYPITVSVLVAVVGAALALYAMVRARWPST